jgi:TPP-dependent pyruvate/acetoin dehydrogenase alpha subunit
MDWTPERLFSFEKEIADLFNQGKIRAPVHLSGGNEKQLIEIFRDVGPDDWVCGSWRMHYQCLLKGVPADRLRDDIIVGKSITLCYPDFKIISSAIVGGILPIALGLAWSIKRSGGKNKVWCFLGDMTAHTGTFDECSTYSSFHALPITWIVEDNGKSVCTDTEKVWNAYLTEMNGECGDVRHFKYDLPWPHAGAGKRVQF